MVLRGYYVEELYSVWDVTKPRRVLRRKAFKPARRRTTDIHKVLLPEGKPVWTLCITDGARMVNGVARWGFWSGRGGYIPWQVYDPNATEEV
jgi:hypothetical protein